MKLGHAEEVMPDHGLPVRGGDEENIRLLGQEMLPRPRIAPPPPLPPALRLRLVAPMVLAVHDVGWVGGEDAADDFAFAHGRILSRPAGLSCAEISEPSNSRAF